MLRLGYKAGPKMCSEFAKTLGAKLTADIPPEIVEWGERVIDAELQEVRAVLLAISRHKDTQGQPCWCVVMMRTMPHVEDCQRARALWAKLALPDPPEVVK